MTPMLKELKENLHGLGMFYAFMMYEEVLDLGQMFVVPIEWSVSKRNQLPMGDSIEKQVLVF